jgi:hypothetical protein
MPALHVTIYAGGAPVGHADLHPIDPGTGAYGGPFHPGAGYGAIRPVVLELVRRAWPRSESRSAGRLREAYRHHDALALEVRTEGDEALHPAAIFIDDASGVWTDAAPRIELVGLPEAEARRYFGDSGGG